MNFWLHHGPTSYPFIYLKKGEIKVMDTPEMGGACNIRFPRAASVLPLEALLRATCLFVVSREHTFPKILYGVYYMYIVHFGLYWNPYWGKENGGFLDRSDVFRRAILLYGEFNDLPYIKYHTCSIFTSHLVSLTGTKSNASTCVLKNRAAIAMGQICQMC